MLIDTHCHIHESYPYSVTETLERAKEAGIEKMICVGTDEGSSELALRAATVYEPLYVSIGVHPHETKDGYAKIALMADDANTKLVAVGEIGLDYFYTHSPREVQMEALRAQMEVALSHNLPIIFHVREAFDDFWPIFEEFEEKYGTVRGVLHSFTDSKENMEKAISKGLYIGVNGISTFTKDEAQKEMFDAIPEASLLFETDAPFLTPAPFRGKVNEPAYVRTVAEYHAKRRGVSLEVLATATTRNAQTLFNFS
ncbi:TatD family hydrolase [Candidatus Saccharibacteria bacterium TM7i]|nr:TatD family hydrolase [Candidatus Saccharibacteria bacterium TM7i]